MKRHIRRINPFNLVFCLAVFFLGSLLLYAQGPEKDPGAAYVIELAGETINPATAAYIEKSISKAEEDGAECLILKLDTPGGLLTSTRLIVKRILNADIPVVVYIAPGGARAGSAGVFITYAGHIAAMAPSTNIGAAHPVQMGKKGTKGSWWEELKESLEKKDAEENKEPVENKEKTTEEKKTSETEKGEKSEDVDADPMSSKILNDTVAFIKALAQQRERNVEWAVRSVTESDSITAKEALEKGVVEILASGERDLLEKIDGFNVPVNDQERVLRTRSAEIRYLEMDFRERFLNILADPNIAYIFMILGFYGLLYEVTHPGVGVPGVMGLIFLVLAFFSMQTLPTNYAGLALIILSLILFIVEAYVPGLGLPTLGGVVCMVLGSILLFESSTPMMQVSMSLVVAFTATTAAITIFLVRSVIRAHKSKVHGGQEGLVGEVGTAETPLLPGKEGKIFVHGELWNALADDKIQKNARVQVCKVDGMTLKVKKI